MNNSKQIIKEYLTTNREHILNIIKPIIEQKEKLLKELPNELHKDMEEQFLYTVRMLIKQEIANAKLEYVSIEDIVIDVDSINLTWYLNAEIIDI